MFDEHRNPVDDVTPGENAPGVGGGLPTASSPPAPSPAEDPPNKQAEPTADAAPVEEAIPAETDAAEAAAEPEQAVAEERQEAAPAAPSDDTPATSAEAASAEVDEAEDDDEDVEPLELIEDTEEVADGSERDWFILKVQSNREDSIRDALLRRIKVAGLEDYFGEIIVPVEMVSEFKNGKKRVVKRKLYPGYIVANMSLTEETWFLVRETPGIGDFTGAAGKPTPMLPHEVARIVQRTEEKTDEAPRLKIAFKTGDRVKINEGPFESFEGDVEAIDEANGRVTVMINIFGRSTPVDLEYWQIEAV